MPTRGEFGIRRQQAARIQYGFRRGLVTVANSHHERARHRALQRAAGEQVVHQRDVLAVAIRFSGVVLAVFVSKSAPRPVSRPNRRGQPSLILA